MDFFSILPIVGLVFGVFLLFVVIQNKNFHIQNKRAKGFLLAILILNVYTQLDNYLLIEDVVNEDWYGYSYIFAHLNGALIFFYTLSLFRLQEKIKPWAIVLSVLTLARMVFLVVNVEKFIDPEAYSLLYVNLDYYLLIAMNLFFLIRAFLKLNTVRFAVDLNATESMYYQWMKRLLIVSMLIYVAIIQTEIVSYYVDFSYANQMYIEMSITSVFFVALAFFAVKFPIFSVYGDYTELSKDVQKKYASSSLKQDDSKELWNQLNSLINTEKPYRSPEYRLNDLAEQCQRSTHHVSQVINENAQMSFSDFINAFRIEEAKQLLNSEQSKKFTILAIAYEVGFNSKTTFYTAFKKLTSMTPSEYKRKHSSKN